MGTLIDIEPLGRVEIAQESVFGFANGLPGFPAARRFGLVARKQDSPFAWMVSLDQPDLAFVIVNPFELFPSYSPRLSPEDLHCLGLAEQGEAVLYAIVNVPDDPKEMTLNLRAPVALNPAQRVGRQAILAGQEYSTRHPVLGGDPAPRPPTDEQADAESNQTSQGRRDAGAGTDA
ncbi:MAG: flagellar assembly protein FliW [Bacillota bacterium]|nr:flagellar assembly protein FliW [Bacillota bacterium]